MISLANEHGLVAALFATLLFGCDNRQAFRRPEPGLERMLTQPRSKPYRASTLFGDGRVMRTPPRGSVSREAVHSGDLLVTEGRTAQGYATRVPLRLTTEVLQRGRTAFENVCATCHGVLGTGVSFVAEKMELRKPPSLFEPRIVALPPGRVFEIVSRGYGLMPSFDALLGIDARWAVVGYLDVLRASRAIKLAELPPDLQRRFAEVTP
ncbi:MAG TPA: cytochrome c [Polyangiaceae bacterium]|nr:cytochrome c [Polyangiaceae bacterium]